MSKWQNNLAGTSFKVVTLLLPALRYTIWAIQPLVVGDMHIAISFLMAPVRNHMIWYFCSFQLFITIKSIFRSSFTNFVFSQLYINNDNYNYKNFRIENYHAQYAKYLFLKMPLVLRQYINNSFGNFVVVFRRLLFVSMSWSLIKSSKPVECLMMFINLSTIVESGLQTSTLYLSTKDNSDPGVIPNIYSVTSGLWLCYQEDFGTGGETICLC